jgi:co-chaperonin GroES (HSP10)
MGETGFQPWFVRLCQPYPGSRGPARVVRVRVVVRRLEAEEKTAGGIIIPDTAKEKPIGGEVIAVGPGARDEAGKLVPLDVKDGDRILFGKGAADFACRLVSRPMPAPCQPASSTGDRIAKRAALICGQIRQWRSPGSVGRTGNRHRIRPR